jgi:UDP-N-acetylglucosamine 2-epimerase (hydrolysing)
MNSNHPRRIVFLTGTRADFGKLKPLMLRLHGDPLFDVHIFVTGMHMLAKYGYTCGEVELSGCPNIFKFINQNDSDAMDHVFAKTILGLSDYVRELGPELIVVHGDRVETIAGATVGSFNHILTAHIEGGEVSGTLDELIRHAVTKLSHSHFVANEQAKQRLLQLGEEEASIYVVGSPDIDLMDSKALPPLDDVRRRYNFDFASYSVIIFHPVTSEVEDLERQARVIVDQLIASGRNYIVIYPNNDLGSNIIICEYERLRGLENFRIYPSMRFEYFLSLLKHADFIIGNSSAGVREAPHYGVPAVNLGSRQNARVECESVINAKIDPNSVTAAIESAVQLPRKSSKIFGKGNSAYLFHEVLRSEMFWKTSKQKFFVDRPLI